MIDSRKTLPIALTALLFLFGCDPKPSSNLATVNMQLGNKNFTLEVADQTDTRTYGLMRRDSMPEDHGMIFVFKDEEKLGFWMKNTLIPLDIIYIRSDGTIARIVNAEPMDLTPLPSDEPIALVLEIAGGRARQLGISEGDRVSWAK
jgi:Uncharacterized conserved protein